MRSAAICVAAVLLAAPADARPATSRPKGHGRHGKLHLFPPGVAIPGEYGVLLDPASVKVADVVRVAHQLTYRSGATIKYLWNHDTAFMGFTVTNATSEWAIATSQDARVIVVESNAPIHGL